MNDDPLQLPVLHDPAARRAFTMHERLWQANRYVYPVVSRRSKGISIGVNLNPDKVCNFDCIYCSVDRKSPLSPGASRNVDLTLLRAELRAMLSLIRSGELFGFDPFDSIPQALRRVNDVAFSGDGEPTTCPQFAQAVALAAEEVQAAAPPEPIKLVLISNATMFHKPDVAEVLAFLDRHNGEVWAKLDAGTPAYYDLVDRTGVPFERVLQNLAACCRARPTVIQTLLMRIHGEAPPPAEIAAYARRLAGILASGGTIKLVQLYTVARGTTEPYVSPLPLSDLTEIAAALAPSIPGIPVEIYP